MAHGAPYPLSTSAQSAVFDRAAQIPWYVWCSAIAVTSTTVGLYWDISWHTSIGRRLVIQTLAVFGRHYLNTASAELLYLLYLFGTFALIVMMCAARERFAPLDTYLKRLYL